MTNAFFGCLSIPTGDRVYDVVHQDDVSMYIYWCICIIYLCRERERCHVFRIRMLDPLLRHWFYQTCSLGFQPPLRQWVEKYNHHCLPKGFNHPNWVNHYFNGGGSLGFHPRNPPLFPTHMAEMEGPGPDRANHLDIARYQTSILHIFHRLQKIEHEKNSHCVFTSICPP